MTPTRSVLVRALVGAMALAIGIAPVVAASDNTGLKWISKPEGGFDYYVRYGFQTNVPTGSWRDRINNGALAWNSVGRELRFVPVATNPRYVYISREDLLPPNGDAWAVAFRHSCVTIVQTCSGTIAFNTTPQSFSWYTGTSTTVPSNSGDLWSVAAHEWGHLVEINHSSQSADTMYGVIPAGGSSKRSLTTHDKAGIIAMYPAS